MATKPTTKRVQIDKSYATVVAVIAACAFIVTFSLITSKMLWSKRNYQAKVISAKEVARDQLKTNLEVAEKLETAYQAFTGTPTNILGGNPSGTTDKDGDNGKIILDALPSKYDFPALTTSVEKMLSGGSYVLKGITGTDDEINQAANQQSNDPAVVEMPFTFSADGTFQSLNELVGKTERSIRPISYDSLELTAADSIITLKVSAKTYYQPAKNLKIKTEVLK